MAIDWRRRRPLLGNVMGGLSGPAIKPIALRCVYQAAQAVKTPLIGIGGIATIDDVMEFLVAGAIGGSTGDGELLQSNGVDDGARRAAGGAGVDSARQRRATSSARCRLPQ